MRRLLIASQLVAGLMAAAISMQPGVVASSSQENSSATVGLTDFQIADRVDDQFLADPGVNSTIVDIRVDDGIVTLSGQVDNLLAKKRASRVAQAIRGVRSVLNQIVVKPRISKTDEELLQDVGLALIADPAAETFEITPSVDGGAVTLSGQVDSYQERDLAVRVAMGVSGVVGVQDEIEVDYDTNRSDADIQADIAQTFEWNARIDANLVDISVLDGDVTLDGAVGSATERRVAASEAWVAGVHNVDASGLEVQWWTRDERLRGDKYLRKSDAAIAETVREALLEDPRVISFNVDVSVEQGIVSLRGDVNDMRSRRAAEQDASNTVGVAAVNNRLSVRPESDRPDTEVEEDIENSLLLDPYVERFDISIVVLDGTAHLYGQVDTSFESTWTERLVEKIDGVVGIENHLSVADDLQFIGDPYVDGQSGGELDLDDYQVRNPGLTDSELGEEIKSELWWSPFVDADDIDVTVDDGVATLTGTVESWSEYYTAANNAYDGGATLVDNNLTVDAS